MRTLILLIGATGIWLPLLNGQTPDQELQELKQRAKDRYPTLVKLKDAGKVGEVWDGRVEVVKPTSADEKIDPNGPETIGTFGTFVSKENKDRLRLYEILAQGKPVTPADVGAENGRRNFQKAEPAHLLKPKGGQWVRKKDMKEGG
jgi:uncharacterized protein YdbL (DUF1318 family)